MDTLRLYIAYLMRKLSVIGAERIITEPVPDHFYLHHRLDATVASSAARLVGGIAKNHLF